MTDIDKLAADIAASVEPEPTDWTRKLIWFGILEGMKLQRERDAVIARRYRDDAGGSESYRRACEHIEQAIRSAL